MAVLVIFNLLLLYAAQILCHDLVSPNIVFISADDLGFNDVSFRGSDDIQTPNMDTLAYQGIILNNYYTDCSGTASASALFTGKYPMKMGTQGPSIGGGEDRGVPLSIRLLPSYLKDLGYRTHFVGKWTLGKSRRCYLPMNRGFETFYGCTGPVDYYTYNRVETYNDTDYFGQDLFYNYEAVMGQRGHLTNVLMDQAINIIENHDASSPLYLHVSQLAPHVGGGLVNLQAPGEHVEKNGHIAHSARRLYAASTTHLDSCIGKLVESLALYNLLTNTIIVIVSDNGASSIGTSRNYGSNFPLRGTKGTPWEGAVRSTAILWHANITNPKIWPGLFHVTDWVPTLVAAAGGGEVKNIDGINQWNSIFKDEEPKRKNAVISIDEANKWGAFRVGDLKIIIGTVPNTCGYYGEELNQLIRKPPDYVDNLVTSTTFRVFADYLNIGLDVSYALEKRNLCNLHKRNSTSNGTTLAERNVCIPTIEKGCLFNITADPEEAHDLWDANPKIVAPILFQFRLLFDFVKPRAPLSFDTRADPSKHSYIWKPWLKDDDESSAPITQKPKCPMDLTTGEFQYFMDLNIRVMKDKMWYFFNGLSGALVSSAQYAKEHWN